MTHANRKRFALFVLLMLAAMFLPVVLFAAALNLSPAQYAPGGYSTITWSGSGCVKSSTPVYDVWNSTAGDDGGRSVAPDVTTVFTLTCSDGTVSKSLTVGNAAPPVVPAGVAPSCYPDIALPLKVRTVTIPTLSNGDNRLSLWTCRTATGYKNERWSWKLADIAPWVEQALSGALDEAAARQWSIANSGGADHASSAELDQFEAVAKVATNGTSTTRPVYPLNADGTRAATALVTRAAVGAPCDIGRRVAGTNYYALPGTQTVTLCTFAAPAGVND